MGGPIAANLLRAGHDVVVYDIDDARCRAVAEHGARIAGSPAEVAAGSTTSFSIVLNDAVLRSVVFGPDGIRAGAAEGHLFCDLSTVSPAASAEVAAAMAAVDRAYLRGKVAGSVTLAEAGTLTVFASGARADFERARPLLEVIGERIVYAGTDDEAIYLKLSTARSSASTRPWSARPSPSASAAASTSTRCSTCSPTDRLDPDSSPSRRPC